MKHADPKVIWLTGGDGTAVTALAVHLQHQCRNRSIPAMVVDERQMAHTDDGRDAGRLCRLAKNLAEQGYPVIVAADLDAAAKQAWNRAHLPGYFEVFLELGSDDSMPAPIAPDMRISDLAAAPSTAAEAIFEEVFGRGQLLPGLNRHASLPAAGYMPSMQQL